MKVIASIDRAVDAIASLLVERPHRKSIKIVLYLLIVATVVYIPYSLVRHVYTSGFYVVSVSREKVVGEKLAGEIEGRMAILPPDGKAARYIGEVGHQIIVPEGAICGCGMKGHLEGLCSGSGMARRLREIVTPESSMMWEMAGGDPANLSAEILVDAVRRGDVQAGEFFRQSLEELSTGLANLIFILNPEMIILGTIVARNPDLYLEPLDRLVRRKVWKIFTADLRIVPAQLTDRMGVFAPLALILDALKLEPEEVNE